jgi:DNA-binding NtrC family response regulator
MSTRTPPPVPLARVLVVDDEPIIRDTVAEYLGHEGYEVTRCGTGEDAIAWATETKFDVLLCDVNLPGLDGLDVLHRFGVVSPETFVILITAYATVETAVEAFQSGAHDYLIKPILLHDVGVKMKRLLQQRDLHRENQWLRRELNREVETADLVTGPSSVMNRVMQLARKVAPTPSTVLILGESGTGKDVLARVIHRLAQAARKTDGRYVAVNCAAIPPDLLESQLFGHRKGSFTGADRDTPGVFVHAGAGTVFLDEIGELPLATQAKLLRVIEQKEVQPVGANEPVKVQARILAATNKDLEAEVDSGRFRQDLYFRLNVVSLTLPQLRNRRDDLPDLVEYLLTKHARTVGKPFIGLSHEAMQVVRTYAWPGNVRELDNALQRAVILGEPPLVQPIDLPPGIVPRAEDPSAVDDLKGAFERFEKTHIERILQQTPDKRQAAKRLGIGLSSLYRKIEEHGILLL